jgi:hypothetical protein
MAKKKRATQAIKESDVKAVVALLKIFTDIECRWEAQEIREYAKGMLVLWSRVKSLRQFVRQLEDFLNKSDESALPIGQVGFFMVSELRKQNKKK